MTYLLSISFTWEHYYKASLITGVVSLLVLNIDWFSAELKGKTYFLWTVYFRCNLRPNTGRRLQIFPS